MIFNILSITQFIWLLKMINSKALLEQIDHWLILAIVINSIFLLDLIFHIIIYGLKRLITKKAEYLCEFLLQIVAQILTILYLVTINGKMEMRITRIFSIVLLLRQLRLLSLFWELKDFRKITETFKRFSMPFLTCMLSLYSVMFFYAVIGEFFFSGKITTVSVRMASHSSSNLYYLINFNDLWASMVTLFHVLVVNNWN